MISKLLMSLVLAIAISTPALAWDISGPTSWDQVSVYKNVGVEFVSNDTGPTGSVLIGPVAWVNNGDLKWLDLGMLDLGIGTRFGDANELEGKKYTYHIGAGGCLLELVCGSYIWVPNEADQVRDTRVNVTTNLFKVAELIPFIAEGVIKSVRGWFNSDTTMLAVK